MLNCLICKAEILPFESEVVVFKSGADCKLFIAGPAEEVSVEI